MARATEDPAVRRPHERGSPDSRVERKRAERMARVERTAAMVFAEKGYDGANFDEIAARIDLRGPSLYHYFSSKEELFLRCVRKAADEVFARVARIAESDVDPVDKLRALFREQILIEVRDLPEFVPLFFKVQVPVGGLREVVLQIRREHAAYYENVAEEIRQRTGAQQTEVRVWLEIAFGALAYLPDWYDPDGWLGVDTLAETLADTLVDPFRQAA